MFESPPAVISPHSTEVNGVVQQFGVGLGLHSKRGSCESRDASGKTRYPSIPCTHTPALSVVPDLLDLIAFLRKFL